MSELHRHQMIEKHLVARGIRDERVLRAFAELRREDFVPEDLVGQAHRDSPLPIGEGQTISQPFVVALMLQALGLRGHERVLEIGTGSGYSAALLGMLAAKVTTVERIAKLGHAARARLAALGLDHVRVVVGDGSVGFPEDAPFDAIIVAAAGPRVPLALREQLRVGGRLVMPVGDSGSQSLVRVTRTEDDEWIEEDLADVSFVPLIGSEAWPEDSAERTTVPRPHRRRYVDDLTTRIREDADPIDDIDDPSDPAIERIALRAGDARLVLLGGACDGADACLRLRATITRALVEQGDVGVIAFEEDWAAAAHLDVARYPTFRWRNTDVDGLVAWLRSREAHQAAASPTTFCGLDIFGTSAAIAIYLDRLGRIDPNAARDARDRFATYSPWRCRVEHEDSHAMREAADIAVVELRTMLDDRAHRIAMGQPHLGEVLGRTLALADRYYRDVFHGSPEAWSTRADHMFMVLRALASESRRVVVWGHDDQIADASATESGARGQRTLGGLTREAFGRDAYLVGIEVHHGRIRAAHAWDDEPADVPLRAPVSASYEHAFHAAALPAFALPFGAAAGRSREALTGPRLARAIGAIYRPERELALHYRYVSLPLAFDEILFVDETDAVVETTDDGTPLEAEPSDSRHAT